MFLKNEEEMILLLQLIFLERLRKGTCSRKRFNKLFKSHLNELEENSFWLLAVIVYVTEHLHNGFVH